MLLEYRASRVVRIWDQTCYPSSRTDYAGNFYHCSLRKFSWGYANRNGSNKKLYNYKIHNESSGGKGFVLFIVNRLPELTGLESTMEKALVYPLARAVEEFQNSTQKLQLVCTCFKCQDGQKPSGVSRDESKLCVPRLAETILVAMRNLTSVQLDVDLIPYRAGLEMLYHEWVLKTSRKVFKKESTMPVILDTFGTFCVCNTAEALFTGMRNQDRDIDEQTRPLPPAFIYRGITFYFDILARISDRPDEAGTLHVIPGNIELESGRRYSFASEREDVQVQQNEATNYQPITSLTAKVNTASSNLEAKLLVQERIGALFLALQFSQTGGQQVCTMLPTELLGSLSGATSKVFCPGSACGLIKLPIASVFTVDGEGVVDPKADAELGRLVVVRRLDGNAIARCVALRAVRPIDFKGATILRSNECISCCMKSAFRLGLPVVYILWRRNERERISCNCASSRSFTFPSYRCWRYSKGN